MTRKILVSGLALAPLAALLRWVVEPGDVTVFVVSAVALVPLAWLIGEATEQAAEHTGAGIGGFLNASFGNAPELIIALFAIGDGLPDVVRGSIAGSIVSNLLLVLGFALVATHEEDLDWRSLVSNLGLVVWASLLLLIPSVPGWHGHPDRHSLAIATVPIAALLLLFYFGQTWDNLRRHREGHRASHREPSGQSWSLPRALAILAAATGLTALVSEILVGTLEGFAHSAGLSRFFVSVVIVAIVGNAAEHGGAIVIARRGKIRLASEIAVSSAAQVALLVAPLAALLSFVVRPPLPLAFRPVELATIAGSALFVGAVVWDRKGTRREGLVMLLAYAGVVAGYWFSGNR
ncbi:MAG TPA: calcium/proton exchanger [Gaiellaceae bacterium]|nr:calcium/proton exchanger [Gaiellaceae bacterium]